MSILESAIYLTNMGFRVFPIAANSKKPPLIANFQEEASTDINKLHEWFSHKEINVGISTRDLVVVDIDNSPGKQGDTSVIELELAGFEFPETFTQTTPTGGKHLVYKAPYPVKQGTSVLERHLDIRAYGGYIVGAGSKIDDVFYKSDPSKKIADCPQWILDKCGRAFEKKKININEDKAAARGKRILASLPSAETGERNESAFIAAAKLKDEGVSQTLCLYIMSDHFKCDPPLDHDELEAVVQSAYRYGREAQGSNAPETVFPSSDDHPDAQPSPQKHPFDILNEDFAFVMAGGGSHILWETKDFEGNAKIEHVSEHAFHQKFASWTMQIGEKSAAVTKLWMKHPSRRSYDGLCFAPGTSKTKDYYNLWRGFAFEPLAADVKPSATAIKALDMFLEHMRKNVCASDEGLYQWLLGYFAHLVQHPGEKPLVSLVFRGGKGVGKNTLIERIGALLTPHFRTVADKRYLTGNFNAHMENCLLFVLDEAFWSGDKTAEGILKSLITSKKQLIEAKGREAYEVQNCMRVVIIGNEDWLVPAGPDERRFAVFDVGDGRKQDNNFFKEMRLLMERDGYPYLLKYLLDHDIKTDVDRAPETKGLLDQKLGSLPPLEQYWFDSLKEGRLAESEQETWEPELFKVKFRNAFNRYCENRRIKSRVPNEVWITRTLKNMCSEMVPKKNTYHLPEIDIARKCFESFIKQPVTWD